MGKFQKGHKKIPGSGMRPGHKSAKVQAWEELGEWFITQGAAKYLLYIEGLQNEDFADRYERLLEYFKPKLQRSEIRAEVSEMRDKIKTVFDELQSEPDLPESNQE